MFKVWQPFFTFMKLLFHSQQGSWDWNKTFLSLDLKADIKAGLYFVIFNMFKHYAVVTSNLHLWKLSVPVAATCIWCQHKSNVTTNKIVPKSCYISRSINKPVYCLLNLFRVAFSWFFHLHLVILFSFVFIFSIIRIRSARWLLKLGLGNF